VNILALDLGTRTGWALLERGAIESGVESFQPHRDESQGMRWLKFRRWLEFMAGERFHPDLVVFERWVASHTGGSGEITAGFTTRIVEFCTERHLEHTAVSPSDLKRWVTGKGNARKEQIMEAVLWKFGRRCDTADEADAYALLEYARAELVPKS
jgi:Holliday junction resolvasome RuvABC endonuclease subunit